MLECCDPRLGNPTVRHGKETACGAGRRVVAGRPREWIVRRPNVAAEAATPRPSNTPPRKKRRKFALQWRARRGDCELVGMILASSPPSDRSRGHRDGECLSG